MIMKYSKKGSKIYFVLSIYTILEFQTHLQRKISVDVLDLKAGSKIDNKFSDNIIAIFFADVAKFKVESYCIFYIVK